MRFNSHCHYIIMIIFSTTLNWIWSWFDKFSCLLIRSHMKASAFPCLWGWRHYRVLPGLFFSPLPAHPLHLARASTASDVWARGGPNVCIPECVSFKKWFVLVASFKNWIAYINPKVSFLFFKRADLKYRLAICTSQQGLVTTGLCLHNTGLHSAEYHQVL